MELLRRCVPRNDMSPGAASASFGAISPTPRAQLASHGRIAASLASRDGSPREMTQMDIGLGHAATTLESRFTDLDTPVLLSGIQALVRVLLEQARLDRAAGLNTGGLISGYRGSPLGGLDREVWHRQAMLAAQNIRFQPGVNEDLAATMLYGTQQLDAFPGKRVDGVFGMWYGKGPGVDRAGDALHCGNFIGTSRHGGVLAVAGDDHGAHSSTYPHQTEHVFQGVFIPVLNPASVAGHPRPRPCRHRAVALLRTVGRAEDHRRDRRAGGHADRSLRPQLRHAGLRRCRRTD